MVKASSTAHRVHWRARTCLPSSRPPVSLRLPNCTSCGTSAQAVGGRIIPNQLWFFAAVRRTGFDREIFDAFYADGTPMLNKRLLPYWSGKLSYQMNEAHRFGGFYHDAKELEKRGGSRFVPAESREVYEGPLATWGAVGRLCTAIRSCLGAERRVLPEGVVFRRARLRQFSSRQRRRPGRAQDSDARHVHATCEPEMRRATANGSIAIAIPTKGTVSYYKPDLLAGSHQFKAGFDLINSGYHQRQRAKLPGNYQLRYNNGVGTQIITYNHPVQPLNYSDYLGTVSSGCLDRRPSAEPPPGVRWSTERHTLHPSASRHGICRRRRASHTSSWPRGPRRCRACISPTTCSATAKQSSKAGSDVSRICATCCPS